jgi:hypothetical protein
MVSAGRADPEAFLRVGYGFLTLGTDNFTHGGIVTEEGE